MTGFDVALRRACRTSILLLAFLSATAAAEGETIDYGDVSNADLEALSRTWATLSGNERRALLMEFNNRMVAAGQQPMLRIHGHRRFGYRVEQPDGSIVRIERTQEFIRFRELDPSKHFGVGFENRVAQQPVAVTDPSSPDAPKPGSLASDGLLAADGRTRDVAVPPATAAPVYQLPIQRVRATENPR